MTEVGSSMLRPWLARACPVTGGRGLGAWFRLSTSSLIGTIVGLRCYRLFAIVVPRHRRGSVVITARKIRYFGSTPTVSGPGGPHAGGAMTGQRHARLA